MRTNYVTLKYVTDAWGTDNNGFKLVITAVKDPSKYKIPARSKIGAITGFRFLESLKSEMLCCKQVLCAVHTSNTAELLSIL